MNELFQEFPKMARLSRECIITEKLDGTNGQIFIGDNGEFLVGSRNRWITPEDDNYGFARWAHENKAGLLALGPGRHFGEWWGGGIGRGYNLPKGEKIWSLFNASRWCHWGAVPELIPSNDPRVAKRQDTIPSVEGLSVVPVLYRGMFRTSECDTCINVLSVGGSRAVPGYMRPEGIVCFHIAGNVGFKKTVEKDESPKTLVV